MLWADGTRLVVALGVSGVLQSGGGWGGCHEGPWGLDVQDDVLPWLAVGAEATDGGTYTLRVACVGLSCRALFQEPWRPREAASFLLT